MNLCVPQAAQLAGAWCRALGTGAGQCWVARLRPPSPCPSPWVSYGASELKACRMGCLQCPGWQAREDCAGEGGSPGLPTGPSRCGWAGPRARGSTPREEPGRWEGLGQPRWGWKTEPPSSIPPGCMQPRNVSLRGQRPARQPGSLPGPVVNSGNVAARGQGPARFVCGEKAGLDALSCLQATPDSVAGLAHSSRLNSGPGRSPSHPASGCWGPLLKDGMMGAQRGSSHSPEVWGLF